MNAVVPACDNFPIRTITSLSKEMLWVLYHNLPRTDQPPQMILRGGAVVCDSEITNTLAVQ